MFDRGGMAFSEAGFRASVAIVRWAKIIRRALALTQEEFAVPYIPPGTLRDWEQGRAQPDRRLKLI